MGYKVPNIASHNRRRGYTLLETLIALAILLSIIVPLTAVAYKNSGALRARSALTAQCLLEQEAALATAFPEDVVPVKRRMIDDAEWVVKTEITGKDPLVYAMTALWGTRAEGKVVFYGRPGNARK